MTHSLSLEFDQGGGGLWVGCLATNGIVQGRGDGRDIRHCYGTVVLIWMDGVLPLRI